jgi:23S rRNA maturation-related 3'-5' exoribonuclease YhaM
MKVYILLANDIEDHYPEMVFKERAKAEEYLQAELAKAKKKFEDAMADNNTHHLKWSDDYYLGRIQEHEVIE